MRSTTPCWTHPFRAFLRRPIRERGVIGKSPANRIAWLNQTKGPRIPVRRPLFRNLRFRLVRLLRLNRLCRLQKQFVLGKPGKDGKMANRRAIAFLVLSAVAAFARFASAQQLPPLVQEGPITPTPGTLPNSSPFAPPTSRTPVPVIEERRVVKGADGQWYLVPEDHQPAPTIADDKDATAKDGGKSWGIPNVTIDGQGKLKLYGFPRGDFYFGTNKFYPSLESPFWAISNDPQLRTGPVASSGFPTIPSPSGTGVPVQAEDNNFSANARLSRIGMLYTGEKAKWLWDADIEGCIEADFYNTIDNPL